MKRILKIVGTIVGVIVLLLVGGSVLAWYLLDLDKVINAKIAEQKPGIEAKLGRKIEIGKVSTRILPVLGGRIEGINVGGDPAHKEDDRALLHIDAVGFDVALWDAILSGGKRITVTDFYVDGMKVNLIRYQDGSLSYQDILDRQPKPVPRAPGAKDEPLDPQVLEFIHNTSVGEMRVKDAELRLVDHETATGAVAESFIRKFNVRLKDVRIKDPIKIHVDAAVFTEARNFELDTEVGPLPADLQLVGAPRVGFVKLRMTDIDLSRLVPYLAPGPARLDSAIASANYDLGELVKGKPLTIDGTLTVKNVKLKGGVPFEVSAASKLTADLDAMGASIDKLDLKIGGVELVMAGVLQDLAGTPKFKDFTVHSTTLSPSLLLSYYPDAKKSLPPGVKLDGAATLDVKATGDAAKQTVTANLDMGAMDIAYPGALLKPKGTAMGVKVNGDFTASDANLHSAAFILDELDLEAKGTVRDFSRPAFDLTLNAKPFSFDRLARLAPSVGEALAKSNARAQGNGRLEGKLKGTAENLDAAFDFALTGVKLEVPDTHLDGDLTMKVVARGNPAKDLVAELSFDADKALIQVKDKLDKKPATPMHLTASIVRAGTRIEVKKFDLKMAELVMSAAGTFDQATRSTDLKLQMQPLDLEKFARTVTAIPADMAKKGFVDLKMAVSGNPNDLTTMKVIIDPFDVRIGKSDLKGQVTVMDLVKPNAEMRIGSNFLDLDELAPPADKDAPKKADAKPREDDPSLKAYRFSGLFDVKRVLVRGNELQNFRGKITLRDGILTMEEATFETYGGVVTAKGTKAEIWKGKMPFTANLQVQGVNVNSVLSENTKYDNTLYGKGDFGVALTGEGFETKDLEKSLKGDLSMGLKEGRYSKGSLTESVFGKLTVLEKIPGMKLQAIHGENAIKDLLAEFDVSDGKMKLKKPMLASIDGQKLLLEGALGIGGGLFLGGTYSLAGALVEKATGGKCKVSGEFPVPLKIGGTMDKPEFSPDTAGIGKNLVEACLKGGLAGQADKLLKDTLGVGVDDAKKKLQGARKDVEDKARAQADALRLEGDRQKAEAEAKVRAEADAVKAAAEKQEAKAKAEAEAKKNALEEEGKKKAKGALKGLGF